METKVAQEPIVEYLTTAIVVLDAGNRIVDINPAAESLLRISARQIRGMGVDEALPGLNGIAEALSRARERGTSFTDREHQIALAGELVTLDCSVTPLPDGGLLLELAQLDRHLRISREHQLISQNRAIRELIRGLAHEIKNPLGGLRGAAQLLRRQLDDDALREYTDVIISEADRLRGLVDGLLGPNTQAQRSPVNIHEILERVRHLASAEAPEGVTFVRDYDPSIPPLDAARDQLLQALLNLVRNALQAVGDHGQITLRTRTQRRFTIGDVPHRLVVRVDIIDNGPGIPPDLIERIFYPMITSRPEGTGIGLPIAQNLVAQHGGLIECSSVPGRTEFTVWLPLEDAE
ncbi:nitrogen regulation protein NR(II) [Arhodomonas aquaeolei]|uniref:nitrogen regulation protein NR(II) n=1 Tax=Arhodomonas aquaeolei TaxID=2369 RepID=UPI00037FE1B4|nr:nitrogen regulation protein NR(II) [Arhodomonas aquaeolei]